ncbi:MAG: DUF4355 domain-containing protein [Candidatus Cloacimonetes bacterium]|nr:DUF4355 domain-containing protein [Candidatus Cloacimonadota bacterium]
MDERKKRGIDIQLFAEGDTNEPQEQQNTDGEANNTQPSENDSEGLLTQEEFEKLTKALEEGNFEEFITTLDPELQKKYQSYMDAKIQKALKTREKNLRKQIEEQLKKEAELKQLEVEGKWKELYEAKQRELEEEIARLQKERIDVLLTAKFTEKQIPLELKNYLNITDPEQIDEIVEGLSKILSSYTQKQIEKLKSTSNVVIKGRNETSSNENKIEAEVKKYITTSEGYKKPW